MPQQYIKTPAVVPVFVLEKWVPEGTSVYDICLATEKVSGPGTIDGATLISGLWRVYPVSDVARIKILTNGVTFGSKLIQFEGVHPFSRRDGGVENGGTRLTISNLPFSYSNEAVERNLLSLGFKLRSKLQFEKARGPDGKLTDWKTGRRFVWIDLPKHQVNRQCKMGEFRVFLFYREMKDTMQCRRCLQTGHKAIDCQNEEVCLDCKKPGHRRGDANCEKVREVWGTQSGENIAEEGEHDTDEEKYEEVSDEEPGVNCDTFTCSEEEESEKEEGEVSEEIKNQGEERNQSVESNEKEINDHKKGEKSSIPSSEYENTEEGKNATPVERMKESTPKVRKLNENGKKK